MSVILMNITQIQEIGLHRVGLQCFKPLLQKKEQQNNFFSLQPKLSKGGGEVLFLFLKSKP